MNQRVRVLRALTDRDSESVHGPIGIKYSVSVEAHQQQILLERTFRQRPAQVQEQPNLPESVG